MFLLFRLIYCILDDKKLKKISLLNNIVDNFSEWSKFVGYESEKKFLNVISFFQYWTTEPFLW